MQYILTGFTHDMGSAYSHLKALGKIDCEPSTRLGPISR